MTESTDTEPVETAVSNAPQSTLWPISFGGYLVELSTFFKVIGVGLFILAGWVFNGIAGASIGLGILILAVVTRPVFVVAVAHAGLLILFPDLTTVTTVVEIGLFESGLLALLLSENPGDTPAVLLTVGFALVFVTGTVAVLIWASQLAASFFLVFLAAIISYGLHRYERVSLGLITDEAGSNIHRKSKSR